MRCTTSCLKLMNSSWAKSWPKSRCVGSWLHRFSIKNEWIDCVQEVCEICGTSAFFKIVDGKIDNLDYIKHHMRQILVPQHPLFSHEYPN